MNEKFLPAAQFLHSMIKIKSEDLINPNHSYPRINLRSGTFLACFIDDIPALVVVSNLCLINRMSKSCLIADRVTRPLQAAAELILNSFGNKNMTSSILIKSRRPNLIVVASQSRYLSAKKYFGKVFGIPEDFRRIYQAPETLRPKLLEYLDESFRYGFYNPDYMDFSEDVLTKASEFFKAPTLSGLKAQMFDTWIKGYQEYKLAAEETVSASIAAFEKEAAKISAENC